MEVRMTFKLPKEGYNYRMANQGVQLACALDDILSEMREIYKYSENSQVVILKKLSFWQRLVWVFCPRKYVAAEVKDAYEIAGMIHNVLGAYNIDLD